MTTLYRPVLIESAEQAEALPDGTVALAHPGEPETGVAHRCGCGDRSCRWLKEGRSRSSGYVVGWTALVPIEAEEETDAHLVSADHFPGQGPKRRLVTPWTPAD